MIPRIFEKNSVGGSNPPFCHHFPQKLEFRLKILKNWVYLVGVGDFACCARDPAIFE
jgi:hypothetical protein